MSLLSENIRYLRGQLGTSQQKVADDLIITRGRYSKYEDGATESALEILLKISHYYHVSIDLFESVDLRKISLKEIMELPDNRILLPVKVDNPGEHKIEIIFTARIAIQEFTKEDFNIDNQNIISMFRELKGELYQLGNKS